MQQLGQRPVLWVACPAVASGREGRSALRSNAAAAHPVQRTSASARRQCGFSWTVKKTHGQCLPAGLAGSWHWHGNMADTLASAVPLRAGVHQGRSKCDQYCRSIFFKKQQYCVWGTPDTTDFVVAESLKPKPTNMPQPQVYVSNP